MRPAEHSDKPKRPAGITLLALLFYLCGGLLLLFTAIAARLPLAISKVPWYIYLAGALYFILLGWGIWGARRWAYFAALLMCAVNAYYVILFATAQGTSTVVLALGILSFIATYLLLPKVRVEFLRDKVTR